MDFNLSERNPDYERIKEQKYAYVIKAEFGVYGDYGAPFAAPNSDAAGPNTAETNERLRLITWE